MQKRLSVARALIVDPAVLLVDEATHDLDPEAAVTVRGLVRDLADWDRDRLDDPARGRDQGFAGAVTLAKAARFSGSVPELIAHALPRRYLLRLADVRADGGPPGPALDAGLGVWDRSSRPRWMRATTSCRWRTAPCSGTPSRPSARPASSSRSCRDERSEVEEAFLALTRRRT